MLRLYCCIGNHQQRMEQVSAVADGLRDADLCQLLHETQLPQTECAMFVFNQQTRNVGLVNCTPCVYLTDGRQSISGVAGVINKARCRRLY